MINIGSDMITIDLREFILTKEKAAEITLTQAAEAELIKILELKKFAESLYEYVQEKLGIAMQEQNLKKVVSGNVTVRYSTYGERYAVGEATPVEFTKKIEYLKANPETIDAFVDKEGRLPDGVVLKERSPKCSILYRHEE